MTGISEAYSEASQASKMELFANIIDGFQQSAIFNKGSNFDVRLGSEYVSGYKKHSLYRAQSVDHKKLRF